MFQSWFEMEDIKNRRFNNAVWIPLYAQQIEQSGKYGYDGYKDEFFGCGTLAVPAEKRIIANKLGWNEIGIIHDHSPWINQEEIYIPTGVYQDPANDFEGVHLVIKQDMEQPDTSEWHLNQDFILALGLKRECDIWVRPSEGYIEVARLKRESDGTPCLLEVRAEHLKDYLCARKMALLMTVYRQRQAVTKNKPRFTWNDDKASKKTETDRWEGFIREIHEGGNPFGDKMAVFHVSRTDVDELEDIPVMGDPTEDNIKSQFWTQSFQGDKCYSINGELWRNEWIEPSDSSPRIARDILPATTYFITNSEGKRENKDTLTKKGRWLWFRPSVVMDITNRRGGCLHWYTAQTGALGCLKSSSVHFGVNSLGMINVYAKDIALLPDWQQQIWAGHNVAPEGKVSSELLVAQVDAEPVNTLAPEAFLEKGFNLINELSTAKLGFPIFIEHESIPEILKMCHRFRATDKVGLCALAKDLARVTADSIDLLKVQQIVKPPKGERWGSLKSLEKLLATKVDPEKSRDIMGCLVGIYELRHADAHLPSSKIENSLKLIGIDDLIPFVHQGYQMLDSCVRSIYLIISIFDKW